MQSATPEQFYPGEEIQVRYSGRWRNRAMQGIKSVDSVASSSTRKLLKLDLDFEDIAVARQEPFTYRKHSGYFFT